jgi:hypothetical protein
MIPSSAWMVSEDAELQWETSCEGLEYLQAVLARLGHTQGLRVFQKQTGGKKRGEAQESQDEFPWHFSSAHQELAAKNHIIVIGHVSSMKHGGRRVRGLYVEPTDPSTVDYMPQVETPFCTGVWIDFSTEWEQQA